MLLLARLACIAAAATLHRLHRSRATQIYILLHLALTLAKTCTSAATHLELRLGALTLRQAPYAPLSALFYADDFGPAAAAHLAFFASYASELERTAFGGRPWHFAAHLAIGAALILVQARARGARTPSHQCCHPTPPPHTTCRRPLPPLVTHS